MKKILLVLVAALAISFTANAQWYVGGTAGLSATTGSSLFGWNITPDGGYILNDKMAVGLGLSFSGTSAGSSSEGNTSVFNFMVAPYYKWAFASINSLKFWLQGEVGFGVCSSTIKYQSDKFTTSAFSWAIAAAPVISYDINEKWAINTKIASIGVSGTGSSASFNFMAISGPSIGVQYNF